MRGRLPWGMRTPTIIRVLVAALLTTGALAVAACGGDDTASGANSAADRQREAREAALNYARCMREHGVDMPDPTFEGGGIRQTGPTKEDNVPRAKVREAENACRKYMDDIEPPKLSEEEQQEFREAALANARCMREHGIENFPDPTFGKNGQAAIRIDKSMGIDPEDPDFKAAEKACQSTMPKPPSEESSP
jgi:hypothetical protein